MEMRSNLIFCLRTYYIRKIFCCEDFGITHLCISLFDLWSLYIYAKSFVVKTCITHFCVLYNAVADYLMNFLLMEENIKNCLLLTFYSK